MYAALLRGLAALSAVVLAVVAVLVAADVVLRNLGQGSLPWIVEASEYALPLATFLCAPWLLHQNAHVRVEVLVAAVPARAAAALDRAGSLIGLAVCLALAWYGLLVILDSRSMGSLVIKTLVFPEWWLFVPLPVGAGLMAVEFVRRLARAVRPTGAP